MKGEVVLWTDNGFALKEEGFYVQSLYISWIIIDTVLF